MRSFLFSCLLSIGLCSTAHAQAFPSKPVRFITIGGPGSGSDLIARAVAEPMSRALGQPILVEAQLGAGGTIAAQHVLAAEPDGHTVLVVTPAHVASGLMYPNLKYDALRDFSGVAPLAHLQNVLVVPAQRGWRNVADLIKAAKENPGGQNYGSAGIGSGTHMSAERFRSAAGIDVRHIPFKSSPEVLTEVAAGRIDWHFAPLSSALTLIKAGRIRAIGLSAESRSPELPDVPTLAEQGLKDGDFRTWVALLVSSKVPSSAVQRLNDEAAKALRSPEIMARLASLQAAPMLMQPAEFDRFLKAESDICDAIIKSANMKLQ